MNDNIQGKVVVITGTSSGLGAVTAQLMIDEASKIAAEFEGSFVALKNETQHAAAEQRLELTSQHFNLKTRKLAI